MAKRGEPLIIRDAHLPQQVELSAYGEGGFRFADMSHRGSLLSVPSGTYGWEPSTFEDITLKSLQRVLDESEQLEVLLIGTGNSLVPFSDAFKAPFREQGIMVDSMSTGAAVRTFNVLFSEKRAIAAAFLAVD
ncbi:MULTISPECIES: Mth938-like domain-containing protein [Pseudovibrio]|uniref:Mth938-like domain-containing protein n=1 Tax=Stappiaceae TaxID=2821832 RepID=UPI002365DE68|nr:MULTISPECIES: MTH938/NDUFAF3 family protein [Pseudovibrio]MDD7908755.1 MTH938/NDUFAF3 family protein [Pseudovibrio exalbescens]MDX5592828.1 MTH938/NDUFAF3 family protein [Pseudovibrio sp. SPO723]